MYSLDRFIRENDTDGEVKHAMINCIASNMNKEIAIDTLAEDLAKRLERYLWDDGDNVLITFTDDIKDILQEYFEK